MNTIARLLNGTAFLFAPEVGGGASGSGSSPSGSSAPPASSSTPAGGGSAPSGAGTSGSSDTSNAGGGSPSPSPSSPSGGTDSPDPSSDPFAGLEFGDLDEVVVPGATPAPQKEADPKDPTTPQAPQPPAPVVDPNAQPTPPAPAPVAPSGQNAASPPPPLSEPARLAEGYEKHFDELVPAIAQELFQLSDAEKEAIENDFVGALPSLGAKVFLRAQTNMLKHLQKAIPAMIDAHMRVNEARTSSESKFYDKWKDAGIDRTKHGDIVTRYAKVYRAANPQATLDQMIEDVGPMVIQAAKLTPPAATGKASPAAPQRLPTFVPAGSGPGGGAPQPVALTHWDMMGSDAPQEE